MKKTSLCPKCEKPKSSYSSGRTTGYCDEHYKESRRKNRKRTYDNVAKPIIHNLKINGCSICGFDGCDGALDFHHVDKQKSFELTVNNIIRYSNEKIVEEVIKCILVCKNCHSIITEQEKQFTKGGKTK